MPTVNDDDGFYEDDEPVEKIREAFTRGEKGITAKRPRDLNQLAAGIVEDATAPSRVDALAVTLDQDSVVVGHLHFGGHGPTSFALASVPPANIDTVEVTTSSH